METINEKIIVTGNTYPVRDQLRAAGGTWDAAEKRWVLPASARSTVEAIRVPVGGREELWEECSRCGNEPVDSSGLCDTCRGTETLTVDAAQSLLDDIDSVAMNLYKSASKGAEVESVEGTVVGHGSPFGGGYSIDLVVFGQALYAHYRHHYEGDRDKWFVVDAANYKPSWRRAVEMLTERGQQ